MDIKRPSKPSNVAEPAELKPATKGQTQKAQTQKTEMTTSVAQTLTPQESAALPSAPFAIDGVDKAAQGTAIKDLDRLWAAKDYAGVVAMVESAIAPLKGADFKGLDGNALIGVTSAVYIMEERLKAVINVMTMAEHGTTKKHALGLAADLATVSTAIFRQAVALQDAADPSPVGAWLVAKDTHKSAHKWTLSEHHAYVAQKTVEFYLKGGQDSQIRMIDGAFLQSMPSGSLCEYVVDAYDVARAAVVEAGKASPGHTVLSQGNDALTAGTFEVQKNTKGEVSQVVIGTFSGHYRTGLDAQANLARHIYAALGQIFPNKSPAEIQAMVVQREGQATNPRTIEVIARGIGLEGAEAQRLETQLKAEAMRWQPMQLAAPSVEAKSKLQTELAGIKDWVVGAIKDGLFQDPSTRKKTPKEGAATSASQVLARIDAFMGAAVKEANGVVGEQLLGTLRALSTYCEALPAGVGDAKVKLEVDNLAARWNNGVAGVTGTDLGLVFSPKPQADRATRVVATVNPKATDAQLRDMLKAGMDVARFNTAHGSIDDKIGVMKKLRLFAAELGREVTIQVDLEGPKLRLRTFENPQKLENNDIWLKAGQTATLTTKDVMGSQAKMLFPVDYPTMAKDVKVGDPVSMNDGTVKLVVKAVDEAKGTVTCEVTTGGKVWNNKGVAFPNSKLSGDTVTDEDLQNLTALIDHVDVFAQSFVQSADDVIFLRERMNDLGQIKPIIAKIERGNIALDEAELTEIALASDALMVARGDLGVELGEAQLPIAERLIKSVGEKTGRPVMLATEVMMSVLSESRGSRGDVDALFGAVSDRRFDAIMLGKETSAHKSPGDVIREVSQYISVAENERDKPKKKPTASLGKTTAAALFVTRNGTTLTPANDSTAKP